MPRQSQQNPQKKILFRSFFLNLIRLKIIFLEQKNKIKKHMAYLNYLSMVEHLLSELLLTPNTWQ